MLHQIVPAVTCLLFAAHVALGCCAHHGHGHHGSYGLSVPGEGRSRACRHHHVAPHEPDGHSSSEGPGDSEDCGAPACHYCKADVVRLDHTPAPAWQSVALFPFGAEPFSAVGGAVISAVPGCVRAGPDLFVLHCALLI